MTKVLIVYASDYGNTKKMAEMVASGVESVPDAEGVLEEPEEVTEDEMTSSDAVMVGTPTHMGSPHWRVKQFIDTICSPLWIKDGMIGKVGAVFATGSGFGYAGGGCELAMLALLSNFAEMGMFLVPLPKNTPGFKFGGLQWGPYGRSSGENMEQTGVSEEKLEATKYHGANVARTAAALKAASIFP